MDYCEVVQPSQLLLSGIVDRDYIIILLQATKGFPYDSQDGMTYIGREDANFNPDIGKV